MSSQRELFYRHLAQTSQYPIDLEIVKAEGIYLYGIRGEKYIDLISGIAVSNLGHQFGPVIDAAKEQLELHMHLMVYGEYIQSPQVKLAARLTSLLPHALNSVYFTNSGTEATEGALKLAKRFTGRSEIITFRDAYHGSTQGSLSVCGNESLKNSFRPLLPDIRILEYNSIEQLAVISTRTASVIIEPIQGEAGVKVPAPEFLRELRKQCRKTGTMLIFDEIQSGMGRTGKLFAFEHSGVVPDILLAGKAFGGGMPLGSFISSQEIMSSLTFDPVLGHLTTFGGHPVSCAAALASLNAIATTEMLEGVSKKEIIFRSRLKHPRIKMISGIGLFLALEFENQQLNLEVIRHCLQLGLITDWFLFAPQCMRIAPPLNITEEEIHKACSIILESLDSV